MARPGLQNHPKFRRLVHLLKEPIPHVVGYLECMWEVAYECGNPFLGDDMDVELAAQWPGEPGKLAHALAACKLIDPVGQTDCDHAALFQGAVQSTQYAIHDLFDHAPDYVKRRRQRELCRKSNGPNGSDRPLTATDGRNDRNGATPAPAPAPAPAHQPQKAGGRDSGWGAVKDDLAELNCSRWRETISEARDAGCTPGLAREIIQYGKANGYGIGAIVCRLVKARPNLTLAEGWPKLETVEAAAKRKAEKASERKRVEDAQANATMLIKACRRNGIVTDEAIKAELAKAGLEWPK